MDIREKVARHLARQASGIRFSAPGAISLDGYWELALTEGVREKYRAKADEILTLVADHDAETETRS